MLKHFAIESTLEKGKYFSSEFSVIIYTLLLFCILALLSIFIVLILYMLDIIYVNYSFILIVLFVLILVVTGYVIYQINKMTRHKKYIELLLQDVVELTAFIKEIGENPFKGIYFKAVCIEVVFCYKGRRIVKESGRIVKGTFKKLYDRCFAKYCNKTVKIFYSPQYNCVLFPKQKLMP